MNIGFIGLGKMGTPMVKNLLKKGYQVNIYDKIKSTFDQLVKLGAIEHESEKSVGMTSNYIFLMIPSDKVFDAIFNEKQGILLGMKEQVKKNNNIHLTIIDGGNGDYIKSKSIGKKLNDFGIQYMDIGFSGGPYSAQTATLAAFVGGSFDIFEEIYPLLSTICNKNKIHYVGNLGSGHFAKVIAHNTTEYVIMGIIGEIASLSHKVGDDKKIMSAVNNGLAKTRLGDFYLKINEKDIEDTGCKIEVTQNAAELALRESKKYNLGMPLVTMIYYLRKMSQELYNTNNISIKTKNNLIHDLLNQIDLIIQEHKDNRTVRSMSIQALLRNLFGKHKIYEKNFF
jgi:3-hydroxyisobutyrate dehydrogenase-like beta-hydroxyacid dehydrogenase